MNVTYKVRKIPTTRQGALMNPLQWLLRWMPTFFAFPIGGLLVSMAIGPVGSPVAGAAAGALAGAVIGTGQWLALRTRGVTAWWIAATAGAMAVGTAVAVAVTGSATTTAALVVAGFVAGGVVGLVQGGALRSGAATTAAWALTVAVAWAVAWFVSAHVIVDPESGYVIFGSSGALLATALTGVVAHLLLPGRAVRTGVGTDIPADAVVAR
jgi:hypothetical protein